MRSGKRFASVLVAVAALCAAALAGAPATAADGEVQLTDAVLRWGMTDEANNAAHAPGTWNFFSAGKIPDPGKGGTALPQANWSQQAGNVAIEKWNGTTYQPATWAGLSTDPSGTPITSASSGRYSNHQFVFSGGVGTADATGGTAHITWDGDVSVLFYSGYNFFYLSDPILDVANGKGKLTATLSGFGGSREDPTVWQPVPPVTVTLADLPKVDLTQGGGFTATPAFDAVKVTTSAGTVTGSFPQTFIDFTEDLGTAAFWHVSGGSTDKAKKALPVTVSFDASAPFEPPAPPEQEPAPEVENEAPAPPEVVDRTVTRTQTVTVPAPAVAPTAPVAAAPIAPLTQSASLQLVASTTTDAGGGGSLGWWLGGVFLVLAAALVVGALLVPRTSGRPA